MHIVQACFIVVTSPGKCHAATSGASARRQESIQEISNELTHRKKNRAKTIYFFGQFFIHTALNVIQLGFASTFTVFNGLID